MRLARGAFLDAVTAALSPLLWLLDAERRHVLAPAGLARWLYPPPTGAEPEPSRAAASPRLDRALRRLGFGEEAIRRLGARAAVAHIALALAALAAIDAAAPYVGGAPVGRAALWALAAAPLAHAALGGLLAGLRLSMAMGLWLR